MSIVTYEATALAGTNKKGLVRPDDDGYYTLLLGGLDVYNSKGEFYCGKASGDVLKTAKLLNRRLEKGNLNGEAGHPKRTTENDFQFLNRIYTIEETNTCCHIKKLWYDTDGIFDPLTGKKIIAFVGKVRPKGPYGEALRQSLENPNENTNFSVRAITDTFYSPRGVTKRVKDISTFDWVNEPGIPIASKWCSPSLESESFNRVDIHNQFHFNDHVLKGLMNRLKANEGLGLESDEVSSLINTLQEWTMPASKQLPSILW